MVLEASRRKAQCEAHDVDKQNLREAVEASLTSAQVTTVGLSNTTLFITELLKRGYRISKM